MENVIQGYTDNYVKFIRKRDQKFDEKHNQTTAEESPIKQKLRPKKKKPAKEDEVEIVSQDDDKSNEKDEDEYNADDDYKQIWNL